MLCEIAKTGVAFSLQIVEKWKSSRHGQKQMTPEELRQWRMKDRVILFILQHTQECSDCLEFMKESGWTEGQIQSQINSEVRALEFLNREVA